LSDEISFLVGNVCARIHDWASDDAWNKWFTPSTTNFRVLKDAVELSYQEKWDLVFLTIFKGIEAEAKRLLGKDRMKEKPDRFVAALQDSGLVSECEFHFLNGLRAVRNEVAHGKAEDSEALDRLFLRNEIKVGVLLAILLLMRLQALTSLKR